MKEEAMTPQEPAWWQREIIYQIYPRSFQDSDGDGVGDLPGIIQRLEYLAETLGVDAIWLSPFYPSPMADFGYDISNYVDVDPLFGTLETFDELVREAHARNLKVIIDFVPNHSSEQHPWFLESRSSRDNAKRDWYTWADAKPDGSTPNNWLGMFGGSAWTWDEATGQYYFHSYLKEEPDLNWRNPEVKEAMFDVMRFWLERGVDGFRIDAVLHIMKDPALRDNPVNPGERIVLGNPPLPEYDAQLHLHDQAHSDIHGIFREMRHLLDSYGEERSRMCIGELDIFEWPTWASYYGAALDELHMPFNFGLLRVPWTAQAVRGVVDALEAALPPEAWPNFVLGNHDVSRIASRVGNAQARVAMMLLLTLRGTPTLYYGDEIGMIDVPITPDQILDPLQQWAPELGRDPARTPMQWDSGPNAQFCLPGATPWLPIAEDYRRVNVAAEREDPRSMLVLTQALIAARRASPALFGGDYRSMDNVPPSCLVYLRETMDERRVIALNFSSTDQTIALPELGKGQITISTVLDRRGPVDLATLHLRPNEGCLVTVALV